MKEKICGIYTITNVVNNKKYVGQSRDIYNRWNYHRRSLQDNKHHNYHLQQAWNKYGEESFEFSIIERCEEYELNIKEETYIITYQTTNRLYGYNMTFGGEGGVPTDDVRLKKSQIFKGENNPMFGRRGELSPTYGVKKTEEQIEKMMKSRWTTEKRLENSLRVKGENNPMFGKFDSANPSSRSVICLETGQKYETIRLAAAWCNLKNSSMIGQVCRNKRKSAGKHPVTGEKLHWKYAEDVTKQCKINEITL